MSSSPRPAADGRQLFPAFDAHHPPPADVIGDCVHCGFCLPTCPTYVLWGEEMDSPRGRIQLMQQGLQGDPLTEAAVGHIDACLGCLACVSACPSGVQYDRLIETTRAQIERRWSRAWPQRFLRTLIFALFPYRERLRLLRGPLRLYQRSGLARLVRRSGLLARIAPRLAMMESLAPPLTRAETLPAVTPATGVRRYRVAMIQGCVQDAFFPDVNAATARVLAAEGCEVVVPRGQGCCGALSVHAGREEESLRFARRMIDAIDLEQYDAIIINSAGCGSTLKDYGTLLADDPAYAAKAEAFAAKVRDVAEWLAGIEPVATRHPIDAVVAYHDACHLAHGQGIRSQPRELLGGIPGLQLREVAEPAICCGSAGVYNILEPEPATELGDRKARNVAATGADLLVAANPGCLMQITSALQRQGTNLPTAHTIQLLDASISGTRP
ncbi:MAG TPA: heterodisulfide reductase-related iron-sulfur binding cluster [Mycobacteriales bacterium]|nr:heterodisulfide reductase-related iron-sulfur binding cluster [Mycobacteriales bacterium]